jgi:hypothetical protein
VKDAISYATTARQISHLTSGLPHLSSPTVLGLDTGAPAPLPFQVPTESVWWCTAECGETDITELGSPVGWTVTSDRDPTTRFDSLLGLLLHWQGGWSRPLGPNLHALLGSAACLFL